jgi:hypothetical protein
MMTTAVIGTVISNASRDARRRRLWVVEGRHGDLDGDLLGSDHLWARVARPRESRTAATKRSGSP